MYTIEICIYRCESMSMRTAQRYKHIRKPHSTPPPATRVPATAVVIWLWIVPAVVKIYMIMCVL